MSKTKSTQLTCVFNNNMNKISLKGLTEIERNLIFFIIAKMKGQHMNLIEIPLADLRALMRRDKNYTNDESLQILEALKTHFFALSFDKVSDDGEWIDRMHLFSVFGVKKDNSAMRVQVNPAFEYIINKLYKGFTQFELEEYFEIHGKYAKDLYRLLKQFRSTGEATWKIDDFREEMAIPDAYRTCHIETKVLKPAIKELSREIYINGTIRNPFPNLSYEKLKSKGRGRGGRVSGIKFTFTPTLAREAKHK